MVEFFNKKEEMLEVQLTEYGKHMLSLGQLDPTYYAFFDDEILYNTEYAPSASTGSRLSENQNDADRRIRFNTPNLKVIPTRSGVEDRVARFIQAVSGALPVSINSDPADNAEAFQQQYFTEKVNFSSYPLGNGAQTTDKTAAWSIKTLKNKIESAEEYIVTNPSSSTAGLQDGVIKRIPQLNITMDYQAFFQEGEKSEYAISDYLSVNGTTSNIYLSLKEDYLVLEIAEENTEQQKDNFDIEVYYVDGTLQQMTFLNSDTTSIPVPRKIENGSGDVEYYFNLYVDNEIPIEIIQDAGITDRAMASNANRFRLNRDLYQTLDEDAC